jgi:hypothetical protein
MYLVICSCRPHSLPAFIYSTGIHISSFYILMVFKTSWKFFVKNGTLLVTFGISLSIPSMWRNCILYLLLVTTHQNVSGLGWPGMLDSSHLGFLQSCSGRRDGECCGHLKARKGLVILKIPLHGWQWCKCCWGYPTEVLAHGLFIWGCGRLKAW